jgi:hypothetical protein
MVLLLYNLRHLFLDVTLFSEKGVIRSTDGFLENSSYDVVREERPGWIGECVSVQFAFGRSNRTIALISNTRETTMAHRKIHSLAGVGALGLCLAWASPVARADLTIISSSVGGAPTGVTYANFDNLQINGVNGAPDSNGGNSHTMPTNIGNVGVVFAGNDAGAAQGTTSTNAAPFISGMNGALFGDNENNVADSTTYLTTGTGTVTLNLPGQEMYIGLLWGSVDTYNTLTFFENGNSVGSITGAQVLNSPTGDQGLNGTVYVNINSSMQFNSVQASSSSNAFEFDNVAFNATPVMVPEPSTFVVAVVGALGMIGYGWRRKGFRFIS